MEDWKKEPSQDLIHDRDDDVSWFEDEQEFDSGLKAWYIPYIPTKPLKLSIHGFTRWMKHPSKEVFVTRLIGSGVFGWPPLAKRQPNNVTTTNWDDNHAGGKTTGKTTGKIDEKVKPVAMLPARRISRLIFTGRIHQNQWCIRGTLVHHWRRFKGHWERQICRQV